MLSKLARGSSNRAKRPKTRCRCRAFTNFGRLRHKGLVAKPHLFSHIGIDWIAIGIPVLIPKSEGNRGSTRASALAGLRRSLSAKRSPSGRPKHLHADPTIVKSASEGSVNPRLLFKWLSNYAKSKTQELFWTRVTKHRISFVQDHAHCPETQG